MSLTYELRPKLRWEEFRKRLPENVSVETLDRRSSPHGGFYGPWNRTEFDGATCERQLLRGPTTGEPGQAYLWAFIVNGEVESLEYRGGPTPEAMVQALVESCAVDIVEEWI